MEKKWWKKVFSKPTQKKIDVQGDLDSITEFLDELHYDAKELLTQLKKLKELEKEYHVASSGIIHVNLESQAKLLDKILERYEFFENDVDINGLRVKSIAAEFLRRANKAGMTDLVKQKGKDARWKMLW